MKHLKRFASILLAAVMVLGMTTVALADKGGDPEGGTIRIENPGENAIYHIYRIFELESFDEEKGAYLYKVTEDWEDFVSGYGDGKVFTVDGNGYVTWKEDALEAAGLAKAALEYVEEHKDQLNQDAELPKENKYTVTGLELGYYLIDSSLGSLCSLTTTKPKATVREKNEIPTISKLVQEDSNGEWGEKNDADIGQTVYFKTTVHAKKGAQQYVVHDRMSSGLTFNNDDSLKVYTEGTGTSGEKEKVPAVRGTDYKIEVGDEKENTCTFHVVFTNDYLQGLSTDTDIFIEYTAVLNKNALIYEKGNTNHTYLTYGDNGKTEETGTVTYTYKFDLVKTKEIDKDNAYELLSGAEFELYRSETEDDKINLIEIDDAESDSRSYRVATSEDEAQPAVIKAGRAEIQGLDSGTYWLEEVKAPSGYNKLDGRVKVTIEGNNMETSLEGDKWTEGDGGVHVINKSGPVLPSTGGTGTKRFYILGSILALGAVILLVTQKRMSGKD